MKTKSAKGLLFIFLLPFFLAGLWISITHISFFDINEVKLNYSGPVNSITSDMHRVISPIKSKNIFTINLKHLEHVLSGYEGVDTVEIERYFPNIIIINIAYKNYNSRLYFNTNGKTVYLLGSPENIDEVSESTFNNFSDLSAVSIRESYAKYLMKWGPDNGFVQMCNLVKAPIQKSLITNIKYINNNSNDFGLLVFELQSAKSELSVHEPVTPERLLEALELVMKNHGSSNDFSKFDLYSNALVKRK